MKRPRGRVPASLEELKRRRDEENAARSKLSFVPRHEREGSPDRKRRAQSAPDMAPGPEPNRMRREADSKSQSTAAMRNASPARADAPDSGFDEAEREIVRRKYIEHTEGATMDRMRSRNRSRFRFDWDAEEDTSEGRAKGYLESPSTASLGATLLYGRGKRGGLDHDQDNGFATDRIGARSGKHRRGDDSRHRHWSSKTREQMTDRDWAIFREDHRIYYRGAISSRIHPARSWEESGLPPEILRLVRNVARYRAPTPIQMATVPVGLKHRDLIGLAETGSGKTAAFVLPMVARLSKFPRLTRESASEGPYALILAPTRELVLQIENEARKFTGPFGLRITSVIGGQGLEEQGISLQSGCEIVVCTPGRMMDLLSRRFAALGNCCHLILDEADRMVDMGFEAQVQDILSAMPVHASATDARPLDSESELRSAPRVRQTLMFSATMSAPIERIAREYLTQPVVVTVGETGKAAHNVQQRVEFLSSEGKKRERLIELLQELHPPIIVFANTKRGCEEVARLIESRTRQRCAVLHSGKSQEHREEILGNFRTERLGVLVATDVLSRGIDVRGVNHVVNFELPTTIEPYTHRIGRTGRAGRKGTAWSFATSANAELFPELRAHLEQSGAAVPRAIASVDNAKSSSLRPIID